MLTLILLKPDEKPQRFKLDGSAPETIGRHAKRLKLDDSRVSRRHAEVLLRDGVWLIRDLGSSNGTHLNGERITGTSELEEGDEVRIGRQRLVVGHIDPPIDATVLDLDGEELRAEAARGFAAEGLAGSSTGDAEASRRRNGTGGPGAVDERDDDDLVEVVEATPGDEGEPAEPTAHADAGAPPRAETPGEYDVSDADADDEYGADLSGSASGVGGVMGDDDDDKLSPLSLVDLDELEAVDEPGSVADEEDELTPLSVVDLDQPDEPGEPGEPHRAGGPGTVDAGGAGSAVSGLDDSDEDDAEAVDTMASDASAAGLADDGDEDDVDLGPPIVFGAAFEDDEDDLSPLSLADLDGPSGSAAGGGVAADPAHDEALDLDELDDDWLADDDDGSRAAVAVSDDRDADDADDADAGGASENPWDRDALAESYAPEEMEDEPAGVASGGDAREAEDNDPARFIRMTEELPEPRDLGGGEAPAVGGPAWQPGGRESARRKRKRKKKLGWPLSLALLLVLVAGGVGAYVYLVGTPALITGLGQDRSRPAAPPADPADDASSVTPPADPRAGSRVTDPAPPAGQRPPGVTARTDEPAPEAEPQPDRTGARRPFADGPTLPGFSRDVALAPVPTPGPAPASVRTPPPPAAPPAETPEVSAAGTPGASPAAEVPSPRSPPTPDDATAAAASATANADPAAPSEPAPPQSAADVAGRTDSTPEPGSTLATPLDYEPPQAAATPQAPLADPPAAEPSPAAPPAAGAPAAPSPAASPGPASATGVAADTPPPAAVAAGRRVVFIVDASGSMVDSMNSGVNAWLRDRITGLSDADRFTVLYFRTGEVIEPPPTGLRQASDTNRVRVLDWIAPQSGNIQPGGKSDPLNAFRQAAAYGADEVYLLSDNRFGQTEPNQPEIGIAELTRALDEDAAVVNTVQFYYRDPDNRLQQIAQHFNGTYQFVDEASFQPPPPDLLGELDVRP